MLNRLFNRIGRILGKDAKQRQGKKQPQKQVAPAIGARERNLRDFHCVEVHIGDRACPAVKRREGIRFLPDEAPRLPVPGCNSLKCTCRYVHHDDRREDGRRNPYRQWAINLSDTNGERRARKDRRKS